MTLKDLIRKNSFKKVFNLIYSEYLKETPYNEVVEADLKYRVAWDQLKKMTGEEPEYKIHLIEMNDGFDCCLYDEKEDELFALDFYSWKKLLKAEVILPKNMNHNLALCHILWEMTFWGFTHEQVQKQSDLIKSESETATEVCIDLDGRILL
tara:strand:+ start:1798 stop:2253 length:456 start_codon:yes stop_codon:yes gene_type:complete